MHSKPTLAMLALVFLLFALHTKATTNFTGPNVKTIETIEERNALPFSCTCSCNGGEKNCSGHCQIFVSCDSAAECFICVSDCCRNMEIQ
jgi:hypothetical protein